MVSSFPFVSSGRVRSGDYPGALRCVEQTLLSVLEQARVPALRHLYGSIRFTVFAFAGLTSTSPASLDLRPGDFLVRMCEWKAWLRCSLPVPVFLNRFAAPRWVFIFGIDFPLKPGR